MASAGSPKSEIASTGRPWRGGQTTGSAGSGQRGMVIRLPKVLPGHHEHETSDADAEDVTLGLRRLCGPVSRCRKPRKCRRRVQIRHPHLRSGRRDRIAAMRVGSGATTSTSSATYPAMPQLLQVRSRAPPRTRSATERSSCARPRKSTQPPSSRPPTDRRRLIVIHRPQGDQPSLGSQAARRLLRAASRSAGSKAPPLTRSILHVRGL